MNAVLSWLVKKYFTEDRIIATLIKLMNSSIADGKWATLWYEAGKKLTQEGSEKMDKNSWEAIERNI